MLGQSFGSMVVALEGLRQSVPDVFLDTTGCAFTFFVAKILAGVKVATYTHYPTITSVSAVRLFAGCVCDRCALVQDMLSRVYERRPTYNNTAEVSNSSMATNAKIV